jgi:hypothetical protein
LEVQVLTKATSKIGNKRTYLNDILASRDEPPKSIGISIGIEKEDWSTY